MILFRSPFYRSFLLEIFGFSVTLSASHLTPRDSRLTTSSSGFTLIELIISITILAIIVTIIGSTLNIGIRSWEKGEKVTQENQKYGIVLELMKRQLASISTGNIKYDAGGPFYLTGTEKTILFASGSALASPEESGIVYVQYKVRKTNEGKETLSIFEKSFIRMNTGKGLRRPDDSEYLDMIEGVSNIRFSYLKENKKEKRFDWVWEWSSKEKAFPHAVKISFTVDDNSPDLSIVASIHSETEALL